MTAAKLPPYRPPSTTVGMLLRAFRERRVGPVRVNGPWGRSSVKVIAMTQRVLALRSGVNHGQISRLEAGSATWLSRESVFKLAEALELDDVDHARLIIAAGFWPWPESEDTDVELAVRVLLSVVRGDYRRVEGP